MIHANAVSLGGFIRSFGSAVMLVLLIGACGILDFTDTERDRKIPGGALDIILLSEKSIEAGPLFFDHRLHYSSRERGGIAIGCKACHHEFTGSEDTPPQACGTCHYSHSDTRMSSLPSL